jgi:hypothetical protein
MNNSRAVLITFCTLLFCALAGVLWTGCTGSKTAQKWTFWAGEMKSEEQVDSLVHLEDMRTFTVIPYSSLSSNVVLAGSDENAMMFALVCGFQDYGYRYVENRDSADFTVVERISDEFDSTNDLRQELKSAPALKPAKSFSLTTSRFGSDNEEPVPQTSRSLSHPVLKIFIYSKSGRLVRRWIGGGVAHYPGFAQASQHLLLDFKTHLTLSKAWAETYGLSPGRIGIRSLIWTREGTNFWPNVYGLTAGAPAEKAGIKVDEDIIEIDGHSTKNIDNLALHALWRGEAGTVKTLKLWRYQSGFRTVQVTMDARPPDSTQVKK